MIDARTAPYAALLLRVGLGSLFLAHAGFEISTYTPAGTAGAFASADQPGLLAYVAIAWEFLGASALIFGFMPRLVALTMIPVLLGAIFTFHGSAGFFNNPNGAWEFPAFWILALVAQALFGDGAFALEPTPVVAGWSRAPASRRHRERLRRTREFAH